MSRSPSDLLELDGVVTELPGWELLEVRGGDRERFLSTQLTSHVVGLAVGASQPTALLDRSGRLQGFGFLLRRDDSFELLVPDSAAGACHDRLEHNVIADDVVIRRREVGAMRLALGPSAAAMPINADRFPVAGWGTRGFVGWGDPTRGMVEMDADALEPRRVLGGPPAWGSEVRPGQLVNETVLLASAVSFDKGCYLGQETVAKIASHRGAARGPAVVELASVRDDPSALVGEALAAGDKKRAGEVLAATTWDDRSWLLVSLRRELRVFGRELRAVTADGGAVDGVLHPAPLLEPPTRDEMAARLADAASAAFAGDDADRALELLERAMVICPTSADAVESTGVILGRLGRHHEAIDMMHRLLELDPSSVMAHSNLSLYHNQLGDKDRAEHHLALATRASFGGGAASTAASSESRAAEAAETDRRRREEMFRQVLEIDPDDALAHFGLGELAAERGRLDEAVDHLGRALAGDPGHTAAILALGSAHERLSDADRARETYERGIEVAAKKGDLATAKKMQERLNGLTAS